jgi:hypothetical protein
MPKHSLTLPTFGYKPRQRSSPSRVADIFFPFNAALSTFFLSHLISVAI